MNVKREKKGEDRKEITPQMYAFKLFACLQRSRQKKEREREQASHSLCKREVSGLKNSKMTHEKLMCTLFSRVIFSFFVVLYFFPLV